MRGDFNGNAGIIAGHYNNIKNKFEATTDDGSINIVGFDIGLPVISGSFADVNSLL